MRILIVHNKNTNFASDSIYEFARAITREGDECTLRVVGDTFDTKNVFRDCREYDCVVVSGGDDAISQMLYTLKDEDVRICVFPSGITNVYFENLGCAAEPAAIARACRIGNTNRLDLGEISWTDSKGKTYTEGFCLMAGTGYDADLMRAAAPDISGKTMPYIKAALSSAEPHVQTFTIEVDGKTYTREGIACMVANNGMTRGGINIAPDCVMNDGMLDVIMLKAHDTTELIKPLFASIFDSEGLNKSRPHIEVFTGKDITVTANETMPIQVDGQFLGDEIVSYHAHVLEAVNNVVVDDMSYYSTSHTCAPLFSGTEEIPYPES